MGQSKQVLQDSRPFAVEQRGRSWWCLLSTLVLCVAAHVLSLTDVLPLFGRVAASIMTGLLMVRMFILYHDYQHGTILRRSPFAWLVLSTFGLVTLNPPSIWRRSHDHHHKHNSKLFGAAIGSFPIMTDVAYAAAGWHQRLAYRVSRHPLTILCGYVTIFLYGMCIRSILANPRLHADSLVALLLHIGLIVGYAMVGWDALAFGVLLPSAISAAMGGYLFYAQHNFPGVQFKSAEDWDYVSAALRSSSYLKMSPLMHWLTGNIGYHHIHHLNHHIPFYRLPEAMAALPEAQDVGTTSLRFRDIAACFRLKVWSPQAESLLPFRAAKAAAPSPACEDVARYASVPTASD